MAVERWWDNPENKIKNPGEFTPPPNENGPEETLLAVFEIAYEPSLYNNNGKPNRMFKFVMECLPATPNILSILSGSLGDNARKQLYALCPFFQGSFFRNLGRILYITVVEVIRYGDILARYRYIKEHEPLDVYNRVLIPIVKNSVVVLRLSFEESVRVRMSVPWMIASYKHIFPGGFIYFPHAIERHEIEQYDDLILHTDQLDWLHTLDCYEATLCAKRCEVALMNYIGKGEFTALEMPIPDRWKGTVLETIIVEKMVAAVMAYAPYNIGSNEHPKEFEARVHAAKMMAVAALSFEVEAAYRSIDGTYWPGETRLVPKKGESEEKIEVKPHRCAVCMYDYLH